VSWAFVKLKNCCSIVGGATPKRNVEEYWDSKDIPWVTPKDVSKLESPVLDDAPEYISKKGYDKCSTYRLPKGAVLFTSRAPIGNVAIAGREMCTNQGFKSLVPGDEVDGLYLYYCMLANSKKIDALGNGATFKEVSKRVVEEYEIPLPPLKEQKRIAAILDKADNLRRKRQQVIQLADEFLRAVFLDMFGDPVSNPKGWDKRELGDFIADDDRINYGIVQPGDHLEGGVPIVRVGDFKRGKVDKTKLKCVSPAVDEKNKKSRLVGDEILITCVGATVGKVALADSTLAGFNTVRAVTRVRLNEKVNRHYFFRYIQSPFVQQYFQGELRTVGQPTLNGAQIAKTPVIIPDDISQNKYLKIAEYVDKWMLQVEGHYQYSGDIFSSLSQEAFAGDL
jgi:type I restriction enzyme S subunit